MAATRYRKFDLLSSVLTKNNWYPSRYDAGLFKNSEFPDHDIQISRHGWIHGMPKPEDRQPAGVYPARRSYRKSVQGTSMGHLTNYLHVLHATGGDLSKLGRPMNVEAMIQERMPRKKPIFHQAFAPRRRKVRPRYTAEDTFVKANVNPELDIPEHHKLLTKFGFQYIDAMPESLESDNTEFFHSYVHEKDGQIIVSSSGAWNINIPHGQEETALAGPGTWLPLETILKQNYAVQERITEGLTAVDHRGGGNAGVGNSNHPNPTTGFGAIYHHYFARPQYGHMEVFQEPVFPKQPTPVEQTIDQVLAGLTTREAIHQLVRGQIYRKLV